MSSPFLKIPESSWVASNALAFAIRDAFPVSKGHTLVVPKRPATSWFDTEADERSALFALVDEVKRALDEELQPDGYNVSFNVDLAAEQAGTHLHIHVIPRYGRSAGDPSSVARDAIPESHRAPATHALATGGKDAFIRHLDLLFPRATQISIVAAFVKETGLDDLEASINSALTRGAHVRVVTGNYLNITEVDALRRLLGWHPRLEARIVDVANLARTRSFHPKSWRFEGPDLAVAFVGSSNISSAALGAGIEWNLRVERRLDARAYDEVARAFERVWKDDSTALTQAWIDAYAQRVAASPNAVALAYAESEAPMPHDVQVEALAALARSREDEHRRRALVVLATGLGKTWLAAFDADAYAKVHIEGRAPRILFIAHREELLAQAEKTFRRMFLRHRLRIGSFAKSDDALDADLVFASVQKLSRPEHLARLAPDAFDYVVVDEVHHGTAQTYRAILDRIEPGFLLGLTATPDRADGGDVVGLFDDHVAHRADIGVGIQRKLLVPFAYFGLADDVDYGKIPWLGKSFDETALARAVDVTRRMEQIWRVWERHHGERTIVFCCDIEHADNTSAFLAAKGVKTVAVHSGASSAERAASLAALEEGSLQAICAVDLFNEGIDAPLVDRVIMLRPTESPVVFLQQLGRGLRIAEGKERLVVLDFIGNHRIFLDRLRMLFALGQRPGGVREFLGGDGSAELPVGSVEIELVAKDMLARILGAASDADAMKQAFAEMLAARGVRPTAGELLHMGHPVETLLTKERGWFDYVDAQGALGEAEKRVLGSARGWFRQVEISSMVKCFKMVQLEALIEAGGLAPAGVAFEDLARKSYDILSRAPALFRDIAENDSISVEHPGRAKRFAKFWRKSFDTHWLKGNWFVAEGGDRIVPQLPIPEGDEATFAEMTRELVDYRLIQYRARQIQLARYNAWQSVIAYPSLRAAAGAAPGATAPPEAERVMLPIEEADGDLFAVRASGDSMDGGKAPIRDGDWLVMRRVHERVWKAGDVVLVETRDGDEDVAFQVKRVMKKKAEERHWTLRSENRAHQPFKTTKKTNLVAVLVETIRPESLAPGAHERLDDEKMAGAFRIEEPLRTGRQGGHLFLCIEERGIFTAPDRIKLTIHDRRPSETAFVLVRPPGERRWRCLGVARFLEDEERWACDRLDDSLWRALAPASSPTS